MEEWDHGGPAAEEMDVEMETESRSNRPTAAEVAGGQQQSPAVEGNGGSVRELLALARQLIDQGKPSCALQAVVMAVKTKGGDGAVLQTLDRARELYRNKLQANAAADQLASLFAECAIAEAQPLNTVSPPFGAAAGAAATTPPDMDGASILAESGRMQIVLDAVSDGSSFVCLQCGGLVGNQRKEEHLAYWCCGQV